MSMTETGTTLRPRSLRMATMPLPIEVSARTVLVKMDFVRSIHGVDDDSVKAMIDNALHPKHLRFVFDMSCGNGVVREFHFWEREVRNPNSTARFNIETAIRLMLGERDVFRRGDIVVQWNVTRPHVLKLIRAGELKETGNRILRGTLEKFLRTRWIGATR